MARKILVTGAAGLIGREICAQLSEQCTVVGVDNNFRFLDFKPQGIFIKANLEDYLKTVTNDFDYIFHMSAINGTKYFYEIPNTVIENNVQSDLAIFKFAATNKNCKLIYASSSEIVAGTDCFPTEEITDITIDNIHNPRWSYRFSKLLSENYLMNSQLNFLIVRFFNVYSQHSGPGHFIRDILDKIDNQDYVLIGADETRSFCTAKDAVDALLNIYTVASGEVVNIGSDEEITIIDAAKILSQHRGKSVEWLKVNGVAGSVKRRRPCIKKLLQYYPAFSPTRFKDGAKDL